MSPIGLYDGGVQRTPPLDARIPWAQADIVVGLLNMLQTGLSHKRTSANSQVMLETHVLRLLWYIMLLRALKVDASTLPPRAPER